MDSGIPSFIGIGATKSGSSWLFRVLNSHPRVFTPMKEIRFFNNDYDKGWDWYRGLFPESRESSTYTAFGEFTGSYLYSAEVADRIARHLPDARLLVILRDPVKRAYSQFKDNYYTGVTRSRSFSEYIRQHPQSIDRGFYARDLQPWLARFPREHIKIFIFEEAIRDPDKVKRELSEFLDLPVDEFDDEVLGVAANQSSAPRFLPLYQAGVKMAFLMRRLGLVRLSTGIARVGSRFFGMIGEGRRQAPPPSDADNDYLCRLYADDIDALTALLGRQDRLWP